MKYGNYLHHASMLLILTGFYSISITGSEYISAVIGGMTVTGFYWIFGERVSLFLRVPKWIWNVFALLLFTYLFYDTFFGNQDLVGNGIMFVIYLQIVKLLSEKTNRDWMQIYTLSFMHILASTVLTSDISFALPFVAYVVLATWVLALFHLKTQVELAAAPEKRERATQKLLRSRDVITKRFLVTTSLLSLSIITFTLMVFFSFPRLSMGNFLKRITTRSRISGFSERVELGTIGTIKTNSQITMRVEVSEDVAPSLEIDQLHWRGTATDFFDGRVWSKSIEDKRRIQLDMETGMLALNRKPYPGGKSFRYRVFLQALNPPVLFSADRLYQMIWDKPMVERIFRRSMAIFYDAYGGFFLSSSASIMSDLTYQAESIIGKPDAKALALTGNEYPHYVSNYFLQLPDLEPEVRRLLESIPVGTGSAYEKATHLQRWIESQYTYTLQVEDIGVEDPLSFFLLDKKQGHCEYFSTALAIALRVHGIPARNVVGFRGGEYNDFGSYIAVRQSDAHSWVEVYFPKYGWISFDPSPLDSTVSTPSLRWRKLSQFFDNLRLRWNKHIIEYDLRAQAEIAENVGRKVSRWFRTNERKKDSTASGSLTKNWSLRDLKEPLGKGLLITLGLLLLVYLMLRFRPRTRFQGTYGEALRFLASKGYKKSLFETAEEFCARVPHEAGPISPLHDLTKMYYEERFGQSYHPRAQWEKALMSLRQGFVNKKEKGIPPPPPDRPVQGDFDSNQP